GQIQSHHSIIMLLRGIVRSGEFYRGDSRLAPVNLLKRNGRRRVLRLVEIANLEVQVRAGRIARAAHAADQLPGADDLTTADVERTQMAVQRGEWAVPQHNCVALAP